jgi:hypothetical protein
MADTEYTADGMVMIGMDIVDTTTGPVGIFIAAVSGADHMKGMVAGGNIRYRNLFLLKRSP